MKGHKIKIQLSMTAIALIGMLLIYFLVGTPFDSSINDFSRIEIQNGTNGKLYLLENKASSIFSSELLDLDAKVIGLDIWSSGYRYKIQFFNKNNTDEIIVKTENIIKKGIFKYKTNKDIIRLITNALNES